jgi:hypothetical protein
MTKYQIENTTSGQILGVYEGADGDAAIRAMLADAGDENPPGDDLVAVKVAAKPTFTDAANENIRECGLTGEDFERDVSKVRSGRLSREDLLLACLEGADDDRAQGWRDYVSAVVEAATS